MSPSSFFLSFSSLNLICIYLGSVLISSSDKTAIVNKYNALRRGVQPTASNMLEMVTFLTGTGFANFSLVQHISK